MFIYTLIVGLLSFSPVTPAENFSNYQHRCVVIYALDKGANTIFQSQVNALAQHIQQKRIALLDLNHWQSLSPHMDISGRQRTLLRRHYAIPADKNTAVVIDSTGRELTRATTSVELVELIMQCP